MEDILKKIGMALGVIFLIMLACIAVPILLLAGEILIPVVVVLAAIIFIPIAIGIAIGASGKKGGRRDA